MQVEIDREYLWSVLVVYARGDARLEEREVTPDGAGIEHAGLHGEECMVLVVVLDAMPMLPVHRGAACLVGALHGPVTPLLAESVSFLAEPYKAHARVPIDCCSRGALTVQVHEW